MALTRKFLAALGIEADKVDEIITAHTETVDALKHERDTFKADAEKLPTVQQELDDLKNEAAKNGGKNPFEPTDLKMGIRDIKIESIVKIGEKYYIKGQNFTEYSKISLDGEVLKTVYLGPTILALNEEVDPSRVSDMKVSQVEKNKEILSTTE